jgi:putative tricarboxylic transport membrane protein
VSERGLPASGEFRLDRAELVIGLALIALGAVVAWDAAHMRAGAAAYSRIGPRAFPYGIAVGLFALGVGTAAFAWIPPPPERAREALAPMAWIVGGLLLQIAILPFAGFSVATGAVFSMTARGFGRGPLWLTYPLGIVFALAIWLFFSQALQLVLPAGPLEEFSARSLRRLVAIGS